jgi:hypothetical protein
VNVTGKIALYALGLLAVFGAGAGVGRAVGPEPSGETPPVSTTVVAHPPVHEGAHS